MTLPRAITRRDLFMKVGVLLNGIVGVVLAVPIVRYLLSPMARGRRTGYDSWIALGSIEQFPSGETRLATYRNPVVNRRGST
jgi:menaquinol-cytochrome c reductase iron-sulfur subunit